MTVKSGYLRRTVIGAMALGAVCAFSSSSFAQSAAFPKTGKPITLIVPYAAGGGTDASARMLATELEKALSVPVEVVNRPGASGQVGLTQLMRAEPDGHTLSYCILQTLVTTYSGPNRTATYTRDSFEPVAVHQVLPSLFAVREESKIKSVKDFVGAARAAPGKISVSTSGLYSVSHLALLLLERAAKVQFASVHFNGGAPNTTALLGGHVDAQAGTVVDALSHMKNGTVRVLGIGSAKRSPFMPDIPTLAELGNDIQSDAYAGIVAPKGTPKEVLEILTKAIGKIVTSDGHRQQLAKLGLAEAYMDPQQFSDLWKNTEDALVPIFEAIGKQ